MFAILILAVIWRHGFRSLARSIILTGIVLFAAWTWTMPLLIGGVAITFLGAAVVFLRHRNSLLDRFLIRAAGDESAELDLESNAGCPLHVRFWGTTGLVLLCLAITVLELHQPYYFCQDDMLVGETPVLLQGYRSLWNGIFPEWDGHMLMGIPVASSGAARVLYPPAWIAYALARHVLGNELAQVDVAAVLHLIAGYLVLQFVLRRLGIGPALAALGSLTFTLSGSTLIMGRCWAMFLYAIVWMPLIMLAVARLARHPVGWQWALLTGGAIGILFQIGFIQLWATTVILAGLAVLILWICRQMPAERLLWFGAACTIGIALAAPLLYQQWLLTQDVMPYPRPDAGIAPGLLAMLLPYPLAQAQNPTGWGGLNSQYMGAMYFIGPLFVLAAALGLLAIFTRSGGRRAWGRNVWIILMLAVLILALGSDAGFWQLLSRLPVLNIINHYPFRLLPFVALFAVLGGAIVAERVLRHTRRRGGWELALAGLTAAMLFWHIWFARASFYEYGFLPTAPLPAPVARLVRPDVSHPQFRFMPWTPMRSSVAEFRDAMPLNLPALDRTVSFTGYDPLTEIKLLRRFAVNKMETDPLAAARAYGVRWHLVSRLIEHPVFSSNLEGTRSLETIVPMASGLGKLLTSTPRAAVAASLADMSLLDIGAVDPLAFPEGHPEHSLPVTLTGQGIDVDTRSLQEGCRVVVNWLCYQPMQSDVAGQISKCDADEWGRILVRVPGPVGIMHVLYRPDWETGLTIGAVLATLALLLMALLSRSRAKLSALSDRVDATIFGRLVEESEPAAKAESTGKHQKQRATRYADRSRR